MLLRNRSLLTLTSIALLMALSMPADARVVILANQTYDRLDTSMIDARYTVDGTLDDADTPQNRHAIYEHAFYTPAPNFQQNGYACSPVVSVSFAGRTKHMHRGTYCIR